MEKVFLHFQQLLALTRCFSDGRWVEFLTGIIATCLASHVNLQRIVGSDVSEISLAQFLMYDRSVVMQLRDMVPHAANLGGTREPGIPRLTDKTDDVIDRSKQRMLENDGAAGDLEQHNVEVTTRIDISGPLIEEVQTSVSGSSVEDHLVEAAYNFILAGETGDQSFAGISYSSDMPPCTMNVATFLMRSALTTMMMMMTTRTTMRTMMMTMDLAMLQYLNFHLAFSTVFSPQMDTASMMVSETCV